MPAGWWKRSLEIIADGWLRRVVAARDPRYYSTFWECNTYTDEFPGDVHAEWAGYVGDAIVRLSHLLPDSWIAGEKAIWLEKVLASQDADGYLGAYRPERRWLHGFEIWSQDRLLQSLLAEHEHSGDPRILNACLRAARRIREQFDTPEWRDLYSRPRTRPGPYQAGHSLNIVHPLLRLYELSGDESLRDLALRIYKDYDKGGGEFSASRFLVSEKIYSHIVTLCEHLSIPAAIYAFSGETRYLDASLRAFDILSAQSLQATGILSGNEATYGRGPRKFTEHCGIIEWAISCARLLELTGQVRFADAAERAMLNTYFGTKSPDGVTLCYNHAPNELVAANWSGPYEENWDQGQFRAHYSTRHDPRCCNANTSRGFPNYIARAVLASPDGGLAVALYGPCRVETVLPNAVWTRLVMETDYPFEDEVRLTVEPERTAEFPLYLRIPGWCRSADITINGKAGEIKAQPGTFARIQREWRSSDQVTIHFDIPISLAIHSTSWYCVPGVAVQRGPLTFALPIPEKWDYVGEGKPGGLNLAEDWNVMPAEEAVWNIALDLDMQNPEMSLKLKRISIPAGANPWTTPPITLEARARRLPHWTMDRINGKPQTPALPEPPLRPEGPKFKVALVPFGFTHLRMTFLPVLSLQEVRRVLLNEGKAAP